MQAEGLRSSVDPLTEYIVITTCGRKLCERHFDLDSLFRDLTFRGYKAEYVNTLTEYEAEIEAKEQQEDLMHEFRIELERELKESA